MRQYRGRRPVVAVLLAASTACAGCGAQDEDGGGPTPHTSEAARQTTSPAPTQDDEASAATAAPGRRCRPQETSVLAATWTTAEGGRSLAVTPDDTLRSCGGLLAGWSGEPPGWVQVVELAGEEAATASMLGQYACHLRFAPAKESWNLEPWRADVAEAEMARLRCNPPAAP